MNIFKNISIMDIDSCLQNTFDIKKKKLKLKRKADYHLRDLHLV